MLELYEGKLYKASVIVIPELSLTKKSWKRQSEMNRIYIQQIEV